ncbi:hypothetical protein L226DRAFT_548405 [Lentinus tigrinus ALCF2SS1-7]|uniref:Uncharacterized protein n=1 Tax=Lentinus tigrinus ALCF2SS1-6 TaxID=1328759 RepID=A0A5C2S869_9APHY|nr:hypothetical protein L227DRAFT_586583 [Lentinus tigrinus ALCF2SS1-6]RPD68742.1 hypothetical protein L226DRAFT_548405 [Lentinus tigrinus ALCF2SS1-7]
MPPSSSSFSWPTRWSISRSFRRRYVVAAVLSLITLSSIPAFMFNRRLYSPAERMPPQPPIISPFLRPTSHTASPIVHTPVKETEITEDTLPVHLQPDTHLEGWSATVHFRDSLRNDTGYMTSFLSAGWTNDQITIGHLIYLAMITGRVPILPPFTSFIAGTPMPFSQTFDVPRMVVALNIPILEWHMVKNLELARNQNVFDEIGCWNIMEVNDIHAPESERGPRGSITPSLLGLDISYTRAPPSIKLLPGYEHDSHSTFWSLAKLAFPEERKRVLDRPDEHPTRPSERKKVMIPPDEQLVCYDFLYYLCSVEPFDSFERDYSPMWRNVMKHAHWTRETTQLALSYLRKTLRLDDNASIPSYITIHARRGDFEGWCGTVPKADCLPPLSAFARRVRQIQEELRERHGIYASTVIMTSDEKDPLWWDGVRERGWIRVDHDSLGTAREHGNWYPVVLDAVIQSMGMGFVGTDRSTFSHMARMRVTDWNHGAARMVKWGHIGADQD